MPAGDVQPGRRPGVVTVLFVGRLEPRKGIDTLLACIPELLGRYPDLLVQIVGDDTLPAGRGRTFRQLYEASHASKLFRDRVVFDGRVQEDELAG
jgi:glycogen synthase